MSSPFLPTTIDFPKDEDENYIRNFLIDRFVQANEAINQRDIATYFPVENQNGQYWFKDNSTNQWVNGFRIAFDIGPLPGAPGPFIKPHNISNIMPGFRVTNVRAEANRDSPFSAIPIAINEVTSTTINVQVTAATINYNSCMVVIEYIRSR